MKAIIEYVMMVNGNKFPRNWHTQNFIQFDPLISLAHMWSIRSNSREFKYLLWTFIITTFNIKDIYVDGIRAIIFNLTSGN